MADAKAVLLASLALVALSFVVYWSATLARLARSGARLRPTRYELFVGFVTDFFDTSVSAPSPRPRRSTARDGRSTTGCCPGR